MNAQEFYTTHSIMTDPLEHGSLFNTLPDDIPSLCKITQNVIIHSEHLEKYGVDFPKERIEHSFDEELRDFFAGIKKDLPK